MEMIGIGTNEDFVKTLIAAVLVKIMIGVDVVLCGMCILNYLHYA